MLNAMLGHKGLAARRLDNPHVWCAAQFTSIASAKAEHDKALLEIECTKHGSIFC